MQQCLLFSKSTEHESEQQRQSLCWRSVITELSYHKRHEGSAAASSTSCDVCWRRKDTTREEKNKAKMFHVVVVLSQSWRQVRLFASGFISQVILCAPQGVYQDWASALGSACRRVSLLVCGTGKNWCLKHPFFLVVYLCDWYKNDNLMFLLCMIVTVC